MKKLFFILFFSLQTLLLPQDTSITCENIKMPNIFTPNNDYKNDLFIPITYDCITNSELKIYNRWGVEVFYSQSIEKGWNGKHFSKDCPEGVYFWLVKFQTNSGVRKTVSGSVNLLR
tara:strand:+ start:6965 stop:7315 length:351 start_codon:yes stop_codon:yes gene_type:complete